MLYAIYAYEGMYGGLHGMDNHAIVDCRDEGEAEDIGVEMSYDVMGSYECISSSFQEEASEEFEEGSDEWYQFIEDAKAENVAYVIYEIVDTKGKSVRELEEEFYNDREGFIEEYCSK